MTESGASSSSVPTAPATPLEDSNSSRKRSRDSTGSNDQAPPAKRARVDEGDAGSAPGDSQLPSDDPAEEKRRRFKEQYVENLEAKVRELLAENARLTQNLEASARSAVAPTTASATSAAAAASSSSKGSVGGNAPLAILPGRPTEKLRALAAWCRNAVSSIDTAISTVRVSLPPSPASPALIQVVCWCAQGDEDAAVRALGVIEQHVLRKVDEVHLR